jgi:hypothetical protein
MAKCYFDFREAGALIIDEVGQDVSDVETARAEAIRAVGEIVRELTLKCRDGHAAVTLRDDDGPLFEVTATFKTRLLRT